jgi:VCBS repeat-containing protein/parallel beta-helix repeat protein
LETRRLLSADWQNAQAIADVNDDGLVTPRDALVAINELNKLPPSSVAGHLPVRKPVHRPFLDTNGDRSFSPHDVTLVIDELNRGTFYESAALSVEVASGESSMSVIYVSNTGSDDDDGQSIDTPFATIAYAVSQMGDGDTLLLKRGDAWPELLEIVQNQVTVSAYGSGDLPQVGSAATAGLLVSGNDNLIENVAFTGADRDVQDGDVATVSGDGNILRSSVVSGGKNKSILVTGATNCTVEDNNAFDSAAQIITVFQSSNCTIRRNSVTTSNNNTTGIFVHGEQTKNNVIEENLVVNTHADTPTLQSNGIFVFSDGPSDTVVQRNYVTGNFYYGIESRASNSIIFSNVVVLPALKVVGVGMWATNTGDSTRVLANTVYVDRQDGDAVGLVYSDLEFTNNVILNGTNLWYTSGDADFDADYNFYHLGTRGDPFHAGESRSWEQHQLAGFDPHSTHADPQLSDMTNGEFWPAYGSPIINAGVSIPGYDTRIDMNSVWPDGVLVVSENTNIGAFANDAPTAVDDDFAVSADQLLVIGAADGLLQNDRPFDEDDVLQAIPFSTKTRLGADITVHADGSFDYDPRVVEAFSQLNENEPSIDSFTYQVHEGTIKHDRATATINVRGVNDPPAAEDDSGGSTDEDTPLVISQPGLLANDSDPDRGDVVQIVGFDRLSQLGAAIVVRADGGFTYDPSLVLELQDLKEGETPDIVEDSFVYTIEDQLGVRRSATVTLTLTGVNDWQNAVDADDVNGDGSVFASDALVAINAINNGQGGPLPGIVGSPVDIGKHHYDANGDNQLTSFDILKIINRINVGEPEGEAQRNRTSAADEYLAERIEWKDELCDDLCPFE